MAAFYADEDWPGPVTRRLRALGHDVLTAHDDGRAGQGIEDAEVLERSIELGRILLTMNRDDFSRLHRKDEIHHGIVTGRHTDDGDQMALRIQEAVTSSSMMIGQFLRINRPPNN